MRKRKGSLILGLTVLVLSLGAVGTIAYASKGFKNWDTKTWFKNEDESSEDKASVDLSLNPTINSRGMTIKMASRGVNDLGQTYKTYSYTFDNNDNESLIRDLNYSVAYADGTSCSEVVSVSLDTENQEFTITLLNAFEQQIKLNLYSSVISSVSATITIDYEKKATDFNWKSSVEYIKLVYSSSFVAVPVSYENRIDTSYSIGSIDCSYDSNVKLVKFGSYTLHDTTGLNLFDSFDISSYVKATQYDETTHTTIYKSTLVEFDNIFAAMTNEQKASVYLNQDLYDSAADNFYWETTATVDVYNTSYSNTYKSLTIPVRINPFKKGILDDLVVLPTTITPETTTIVF